MKTRHKEKLDIPAGFENFLLEESGGTLSYEQLENQNKELVLISAPAEFDINKLKGEQFILNGCKLLDSSHSESEGIGLKWEVHSSLATSDKHLNILLPSDVQHKHLISNPVSTTLNVVRDIHIPTNLKSPERKKKGTRLPKPIGLKTRWVPYGSESPSLFKMNVPIGVVQHDEEIVSYGEHKKIKDNTNKEKKSSTSQSIDCNPNSKMMDKANNIVDSDSKKKKKKKKELNITGDNICDSETNLTDPMEVDVSNVLVNVKSESKELTGIVIEGKQKKKKHSKLSEEDEQKDINAKVEDSVMDRPSVIEDNMIQKSVSNGDVSIDHVKKHKKKKEKNTYFQPTAQENEELILDKLMDALQTVTKSEDVYPVDHNMKKHKKKKKKQCQHEEEKSKEAEDSNLGNCVHTTGNEIQHENIKEKDNENNCPPKRKKKKKSCEENVDEDMKSDQVIHVNQTMNEIKEAIDNVKNESLVDVSCKKHKKKKKKDNESQEKPIISINTKNEMTVQDEMIYKQNNLHEFKIEEENALAENEIQQMNVTEKNNENPCASKKKKKKKKSHGNGDEDMKSNLNQTNMNEITVAIDNAKEESLVDVSYKKHKKKKKKDNESYEKPIISINTKNEMTVQDEMIYKQNNLHQIKTEEESGFMEHSDSINIKKKTHKRKRKISLNEHNENDTNTKSDVISSHSTHLVDVTKRGISETNSNLPETHANMDDNKRHSKKRKHKTVLTDDIDHKKQKLDSSIDSSSTKLQKKANKGLLKTDSDLDSDDEARIFGVIPKRGFSA